MDAGQKVFTFGFFPVCSWAIDNYVVLEQFFSRDNQKQWLLVEMVSMSGDGGGGEVMMKRLSINVSLKVYLAFVFLFLSK